MRAVECLLDIPFSDASFLPPPDPAARKAPPELSAAEKARLNKFAKILIMSDNRKATAVVDYVKTILERELKVTLDKPFKEWLLLHLDPQQESDHSTILALRHMSKVSFI